MEQKVRIDSIYIPSEDIVARIIQDELIIVPLVSGIADVEDDLFTLNETGRAIWDRLDGKRNLKKIAECLSEEFDSTIQKLEEDVVGFVQELVNRKILIEA